MKVWIILTFLGQIGASWGPIPRDMEGCQSLVRLKNSELQTTYETSQEAVDALKKEFPNATPKDVVLSCVESEERPQNAMK